jgi:hypothetical protein
MRALLIPPIPYIEQPAIWVDFHNRLADEISAELNRAIRPKYFARLTPRTTYDVVELAQARTQMIRPDVGILRRTSAPRPTFAGSAIAEPVIDPSEPIVLLDRVEFLSVEVLQSRSETLVTAIEILFPVNKLTGHLGYEDYHRKRRELIATTVHLMEIDLLRGGTRPLPVASSVAYYVFLSRAAERPNASAWSIGLRSRLPVVAVPLLAPDPDVPLDLGAVIATVYERGGYDVQIDYNAPVPPPPLSLDDTAWTEELLADLRDRQDR